MSRSMKPKETLHYSESNAKINLDINRIMNSTLYRYAIFTFVLFLLLILLGCAGKGLVAERYTEDFFKVPKLLPDKLVAKKPPLST